jgi:hypothetical protein
MDESLKCPSMLGFMALRHEHKPAKKGISSESKLSEKHSQTQAENPKAAQAPEVAQPVPSDVQLRRDHL